MTDPWDERYIYLHENHEIPAIHVGEYTVSSHGSYGKGNTYPGFAVITWNNPKK